MERRAFELLNFRKKRATGKASQRSFNLKENERDDENLLVGVECMIRLDKEPTWNECDGALAGDTDLDKKC